MRLPRIKELPKDESMMGPFLRNRLFEVKKKEATERVDRVHFNFEESQKLNALCQTVVIPFC